MPILDLALTALVFVVATLVLTACLLSLWGHLRLVRWRRQWRRRIGGSHPRW